MTARTTGAFPTPPKLAKPTAEDLAQAHSQATATIVSTLLAQVDLLVRHAVNGEKDNADLRGLVQALTRRIDSLHNEIVATREAIARLAGRMP